MSMKSAYSGNRMGMNERLVRTIAGGLISSYGKRFIQNKVLDTVNAMATSKKTPSKYTKRTKKGTSSNRKSKKSRRSKPSLRKEVKQIKRQLNADSAKHVYKSLAKRALGSSVGLCNYSEQSINTCSNIESYIAQLRYYDPATPGTLVTASAGTGTYQRELFIKNIHSKLEFTNSYQVPIKIKVYLLKAKGDTNLTPATYYNNSCTDQVINASVDVTTRGIYPTDLNAFMAQWDCKCVKDVYLDTGSRFTVSHNTGSFKYDPSIFDTHSLEYQKKFKCATWFIRLEGAFGHDTSAAEQTSLQSGVDVNVLTTATIMYDGGINLDDIYIANSQSTSFTNGGVIANKPVSDNQSFSTA